MDARTTGALLAVLDPVEGTESFRSVPVLKLSQPPTEMAEDAAAVAVASWAIRLNEAGRQRGASDSFDRTVRNRIPNDGEAADAAQETVAQEG